MLYFYIRGKCCEMDFICLLQTSSWF